MSQSLFIFSIICVCFDLDTRCLAFLSSLTFLSIYGAPRRLYLALCPDISVLFLIVALTPFKGNDDVPWCALIYSLLVLGLPVPLSQSPPLFTRFVVFRDFFFQMPLFFLLALSVSLPAPCLYLPLPELWPGATQMFLAATLLFSLLLQFQTADSEAPARRCPTSLVQLLFDSPRYLPSSQSGEPCIITFTVSLLCSCFAALLFFLCARHQHYVAIEHGGERVTGLLRPR
jgi:hypothetical protein